MSRRGPTYRQVMAKLKSVGLTVDLYYDRKFGWWSCNLSKFGKEMADDRHVSASGLTRTSALWAAAIEMIKAI